MDEAEKIAALAQCASQVELNGTAGELGRAFLTRLQKRGYDIVKADRLEALSSGGREAVAWMFSGKGNGETVQFATLDNPDVCTQHWPLDRWTRGFEFTPLFAHAQAAGDGPRLDGWTIEQWAAAARTREEIIRRMEKEGLRLIAAVCAMPAPLAQGDGK